MAHINNLSNTGSTSVNLGRLRFFHAYNNGAATAFVKLYNKATAATSSDTPILVLIVPAGGGANAPIPNNDGIAFPLGLSIRATTEATDAGTTSPGANEVGLSYSN